MQKKKNLKDLQNSKGQNESNFSVKNPVKLNCRKKLTFLKEFSKNSANSICQNNSNFSVKNCGEQKRQTILKFRQKLIMSKLLEFSHKNQSSIWNLKPSKFENKIVLFRYVKTARVSLFCFCIQYVKLLYSRFCLSRRF